LLSVLKFDVVVALLITNDQVFQLFGTGQVQPGKKTKVNEINVVFIMIGLTF